MHPPVPLHAVHTLLFLLFTLSFASLLSCSPVDDHNKNNAPKDLVRTSCVHASYPDLCLRTLSSYTGPAPKTPRDLAQAAIRITLSRAHKLHSYLTRQLSAAQGTPSKRQRAVLRDCVEQISDSADELRRTLGELKHLRRKTFRWQMSNAQTWVSAALTNEDTCLDGFQDVVVEDKIKSDVRRKIRNVAKVTSNALYMINRLDNTSVSSGDPA